MNRIGLYFFVVASILSIVDGSLETISPELQIAKSILLVFSGLVIGLLLFDYERDFLWAGIGFVVAGSFIMNTLGDFFVASPFGKILTNFIIVFAASSATIAFRELVGFITRAAGIEETPHEGVTIEHLRKSSFENVWGIIILIAVAIAILQLLLETFYNLVQYQIIVDSVDIVVNALFFVDLIILYEKRPRLGDFFKKNIFDVLAVVPSIGFFRVFKIIRAVKIVKIFKASSKLSKIVKVSRTAKFFSSESSMSRYVKPKKKHKKVRKKSPKKKK